MKEQENKYNLFISFIPDDMDPDNKNIRDDERRKMNPFFLIFQLAINC
jgi:hypothetical protein